MRIKSSATLPNRNYQLRNEKQKLNQIRQNNSIVVNFFLVAVFLVFLVDVTVTSADSM